MLGWATGCVILLSKVKMLSDTTDDGSFVLPFTGYKSTIGPQSMVPDEVW